MKKYFIKIIHLTIYKIIIYNVIQIFISKREKKNYILYKFLSDVLTFVSLVTSFFKLVICIEALFLDISLDSGSI